MRRAGPASRTPRQRASDSELEEEYRLAGLCLQCGQPNDRLGRSTKNGKAATKCAACVESQRISVGRSRDTAKSTVDEMRLALGLTVEEYQAMIAPPRRGGDMTKRSE